MTYAVSFPHSEQRPAKAVYWLIGINVLIYFLQVTLVGSDDMARWLGFDASELTSHWWTIFTYMFVHAGLTHLLFNMVTLWAFGPKVERAWGSAAFVRYYLLCGLGGWLAHLLVVRHGVLIGASAAIFGVMLAYAVRWPNDEFLLWMVIPVKAKWLVLGLAVMNVIIGVYTLGGDGAGTAYFAHLGGLATGWLYLHTPPAQAFERFRQRVAATPDAPEGPPRLIPRTQPRSSPATRPQSIQTAPKTDDIVAQSKAITVKRSTLTPSRTSQPASPFLRSEDRLDAVLDKISKVGLEGLTADERKVLEEMSKRLRKNS